MKIRTVIRKSDAVVWEGEAESISSTNERGNFDILPQHAHFVGLIEKYVEVRTGGGVKRWEIEKGVLTVNDEIVEVYLGY